MTNMLTPEMSEKKNHFISRTIAKFGNSLGSFIRSKVGSNEDAEDILQEVWYQLSSFGDLERLENISAWLYRVARNKVTDKYRKKSENSLESMSVFESDDTDELLSEILIFDDSENPELAMFKESFWEELMAALDELPESQRRVFILNELEDMTLQQIADKSNENIKAIISRKNYAVKHLRKRLNQLYNELNF